MDDEHNGWAACLSTDCAPQPPPRLLSGSSTTASPQLRPTKRARADNLAHHPASHAGNNNGEKDAAAGAGGGDTVFVGNVPLELQGGTRLRDLVGSGGLRGVKTHFDANKRRMLAWLSFTSAPLAHAALTHLRAHHPRLHTRMHAPSTATATEQDGMARFDSQVTRVRARGGLCCTLLFVNLPHELQSDELQTVLMQLVATHKEGAGARAGEGGRAVRVRFSACKGLTERNFWCVFADAATCRRVFSAAEGRHVAFRCGRAVTLRPRLHDDARDADDTTRRVRSAELGPHPSSAGGRSYMMGVSETDGQVQRLECFLRTSLKHFVFLPQLPNQDPNL